MKLYKQKFMQGQQNKNIKGLIQMNRSQSQKNSRNKQPLRNLNDLLQQYQTEVTRYPKSARYHSRSQNIPKATNIERIIIHDMNIPVFKALKLGQAGDYIHSRTMSQCVKSGQLTSPDKILKSCQQLRKQKMIHMFSMQNMRKQLINSRKMSGIQYRTRQIQKKQLKDPKQKKNQNKKSQNNLKIQMPKNLSNKQLDYMVEYRKSSEKQSNLLDQYKRAQKQRGIRDQLKKSRQYSSNNEKQGLKKQFLKKGTSINKSILNSLIKLKLSRNNQDIIKTERQTQKYIGNDQIYKMIKVYKGLQPVITQRQRHRNRLESQTKQKDQNYIQGWYHQQTDDFDIQPNQIPPNTQSSQI